MITPTFSIIIPHHNCPELLSRCIGSVPDHDKIEIILIDDNSDDKVKFENYLNKIHHKNLRLIRSIQSRWAGGARNLGLDAAQGKWILFLDADDFFLDNAFRILNSLTSSVDDIIYFKHESVFSDDILKPCTRFAYRNNAIDKYLTSNSCNNIDALKFGDIVPWGKLIRRSLIEKYHIRFEEIPCCEDVMFITKCAQYAKNISVRKDVLYCLTYRPLSLSMAHSKEKDWVSFTVALERNRLLKELGKKNQMTRILSHVIRALRRYGVRESYKYIKEIRLTNNNLFEGMFRSIGYYRYRFIDLFSKNTFQA